MTISVRSEYLSMEKFVRHEDLFSGAPKKRNRPLLWSRFRNLNKFNVQKIHFSFFNLNVRASQGRNDQIAVYTYSGEGNSPKKLNHAFYSVYFVFSVIHDSNP